MERDLADIFDGEQMSAAYDEIDRLEKLPQTEEIRKRIEQLQISIDAYVYSCEHDEDNEDEDE